MNSDLIIFIYIIFILLFVFFTSIFYINFICIKWNNKLHSQIQENYKQICSISISYISNSQNKFKNFNFYQCNLRYFFLEIIKDGSKYTEETINIISQYNKFNVFKNLKNILVFRRLSNKINKIQVKIQKLNDMIQDFIELRHINADYKIFQARTLNSLKEKYEIISLDPKLNSNYSKKIHNLNDEVKDIDRNIELTDKEIECANFSVASHLIKDTQQRLYSLLSMINVFPTIIHIYNCTFPQLLTEMQNKTDQFIQNNMQNNFEEKINNRKSLIFKNLDKTYKMILNWEVEEAIKLTNTTFNNLNKLNKEISGIYERQMKYSEYYKNITQTIDVMLGDIQKVLIKFNSDLVLKSANDSEKIIYYKASRNYTEFQKNYNIFIKNTNYKYSKMKYDLSIMARELCIIIKKFINLLSHVIQVSKIYLKYNKFASGINNLIFNCEARVNKLMYYSKKYQNHISYSSYITKFQTFFNTIEKTKKINISKLKKSEVETTFTKLTNMKKEIDIFNSKIQDLVFLDALSEKLIIYNQRYLLKYPQIKNQLSDTKLAYKNNEINTSIKLSISLLENIKNIQTN